MRNHLNKSNIAPYRPPSTTNHRLQEALAMRERYLERHPHLRAYQEEIDRVLDKSGNSQGRMAVLGTLMQAKLLEMQKELHKLTRIVQ